MIFQHPQYTPDEILEAYAEGKKIFQVVNPQDADDWIYEDTATVSDVIKDIVEWLHEDAGDGLMKSESIDDDEKYELPDGWHVRELPETEYRIQHNLPEK